MIYEFESAKGKRLELYYPMDEAPKIGEAVSVDGVEYRRIPSMPTVRPDEKPVISHASPRWHGMKEKSGGFYRHYTKDGKPIIDSRAARDAAQRDAAVVGETISNAREILNDD